MSKRAQIARRTARRLQAWGVGINLFGVAVAFAYLAVVFPPQEGQGRSVTTNLIALAVYLPLAWAISTRGVRETTSALRAWAESERAPRELERRLVLRLPVLNARWTGTMWAVGAVAFTALNLPGSPEWSSDVFGTIVLCGLAVTTAEFLGNERLMRPAVALVLSRDPPPEAGALGVTTRIMLTWLLCAAAPLAGIAFVPFGRVPDEPRELGPPLAFLAGCVILAGGVAFTLAARAVALPVRNVRRAMDRVAAGELEVAVDVDDGSEIGRLEAGFNRMVEGLRERERLRDLFGRQVGADVAREALERGAELGGEAREVSALFVDVIGSTTLAAREPPERVVELLNAFFATVVEVVERHGGIVNKFEGDAALCIFGAPVEEPDHAARALAAARELSERLRGQGGLDAAVGVSAGVVVAGNVGTERRFEYTVIGDAVNEAARLTELAKERAGRVIASEAIVTAAAVDDWELGEPVLLRGRETPTRLAEPRDGG